MSVVAVGLAALAWLSALVCAHDAVSGDSAGGGLARSLLIPSLVLLASGVLALAWTRSRGGVSLSWGVLFAAFSVAVVGAVAAASVIFAAPLVKTWATVAQVGLAGQGMLMIVLAWRGTGALSTRSPLVIALAVLVVASVIVVLPTRRAHVAAVEQIRAERAAEEAAAQRR